MSITKYVQSKRGSMMWENEDPTVAITIIKILLQIIFSPD